MRIVVFLAMVLVVLSGIILALVYMGTQARASQQLYGLVVLPDGKPAGGATVKCKVFLPAKEIDRAAPSEVQTLLTDSDGRFVVFCPRKRVEIVSIHSGSLQLQTSQRLFVSLRADAPAGDVTYQSDPGKPMIFRLR